MTSPSPTPLSSSPAARPNQIPRPTALPRKRDKRRHALGEKLSALNTSFHNPTNPCVRDMHYRSQLASLQADINLITRCDASGRDMRLLDDSPDLIHSEFHKELERMGMGDLVAAANAAGRASAGAKDDGGAVAITGMAGREYGQFVEDVNQGMEERDAQLTLLYNNYNHKANSLDFLHKRSVVLAKKEHQSLSRTIQSRLMARLGMQLKRLAVERESTSLTAPSSLASLSSSGYADFTGTSALLPQPFQFGLAPPAPSPSRATEDEKQTRRKPRRREVEELLSLSTGPGLDTSGPCTGKRRRVTRRDREAAEIAETHTPPTHGAPSPSSSSAVLATFGQRNLEREAPHNRREEMLKQFYFPVYSYDKLFTEKELQMAGNQASLATMRHFMERPQMHYNRPNPDLDTVHTVGGSSTPHRGGTPDADDGVGTGGGTGSGNGDYSGGSNPPRLPREVESLVLKAVSGSGMTFVNKAGVAPPPPALRGEEIDMDLAAMRGEMPVVRSDSSGDGEREAKK